jgi:flagellar protein FliS
MKLNNGHTLYKQADVSCSAPQLTLMLYDGAIRYIREAVEHLRAGQLAEKGRAVESAYECLSELRHGLNRAEGGEAADTLDRMYDLLGTKLSLGNASRDIGQLEQVLRSLESLRSAWVELFDRLRQEGKLTQTGTFGPAPTD